MIHLVPNATSNTIYLTPFEARKFLPSFTNYLMVLKNNATEKEHFAVLRVDYDNERYTQCDLRTDIESITTMLITESGLYTYKVYGQNSASNLDPTDESVVGLCEVGPCRVLASEAWETPDLDIPDNIIYYE